MTTRALGVVLAIALGAVTGAAQTFVVGGGPGSNFTSIAAALAAVPDGSTLLVRAGSYGFFEVRMGVRILGEPGTAVDSAAVRGTSPAQSVLLSGLSFNSPPSGSGSVLSIQDAQGQVFLEGSRCTSNPSFAFWPGATLRVSNSAQVLLHGCTILGMVEAFSSDLAIVDSSVQGDDGSSIGQGTTYWSAPALSLHSGSAQVAGSLLSGGDGYAVSIPPPNQPAIFVAAGAAVRVFETTTLQVGTASGLPGSPAVEGSGVVRMDPLVVLPNNMPLPPALTVLRETMPTVSSRSAAIGGTISGTAIGPAGDLTVLVVGLSGLKQTLPGIRDPFWFDPAVHHFAAFGVPQPGAPLTASIPVPMSSTLRGTTIAWQSASLTTGVVAASNPAVSVVN